MKRKYRGFAGHFIAAASCRFHICTEVGDVLVSTVGAYLPKGEGEFEEIGYKRKFETFVFSLGSTVCDCGCGERKVETWSEIDTDGYNDPKAATDGHEAMCKRYERKAARRATITGASA